jgi:phage/plasmid-like protein (TIGR03299 family)
MASEFESGVFGNGAQAWHLQGKVREGCMSGDEAIVDGGLDWESLESPLFDSFGTPIKGRKVIYRSTDHRHLGIVSNDYVPINNRELFEFLDAIVGQMDGVHYDAAGSLRNGEVVFVNIDLHKVFEVVPGDVVKRYLGASMGHNGLWGLRLGQIDTRQVCMNTVKAAWSEMEGGKHFLFHHRGLIRDHLAEARKAVGFALAGLDRDAELLARLAAQTYTTEQMTAYVNKVFPLPNVKPNQHAQSTQVQYEYLREAAIKSRVRVIELSEVGMGTDIPGVKGTWWGLYNGVTQWADHEFQRASEGRAESVLFGTRAQTKVAALNLALRECGVAV